MGQSFPSKDKDAGDGAPDHEVGEADASSAPKNRPSKPLSEPPPPPPLVGQQVADSDDDGEETLDGEDSSGIDEWLLEWEDDRSEAKPARKTRKLPPIEHQPPPIKPQIDGLKITSDNTDETPTVEPDLAAFTEPETPYSAPTRPPPTVGPGPGPKPRNAADTNDGPPSGSATVGDRTRRRIPAPPLIRSTPPVRSTPLVRSTPPSAPQQRTDESQVWTVGGGPPPTPTDADPLDFGLADTDDDGQSEVTELDIARVARTTSTRTVKVGGIDVTIDGSQRTLATLGVVGTLVVAFLAVVVSGIGSDSGDDAYLDARDTETREAAVLDDQGNLFASGPTPAAPSTSELAQSTVQIVGLNGDEDPVCAGSGIVVDSEGVVLTNAHVVTVGPRCDFVTVAVAVTGSTSQPPELLYEAEILATDPLADLAVVHIVGPLPSAPDAPFPRSFRPATLGDSDQVELGDDIRILGYPVIGGDTITSTSGSVSGFSSQIDLGDRAWIKTDGAISAGNSGGMAVNEAGEVIGIPTRARATESGPAIDCRALEDTNDDGAVDEADNCESVGGFLNGIRPINLAADLLESADRVRRSQSQIGTTGVTVDLSNVSFNNPRFSTGELEDNPINNIQWVREGNNEICLFIDWAGMTEGAAWSVVWMVDGEQITEFGRLDETWDFDESGFNFWYCAKDENGHKPGVYEIGLFIDDQLAFVEAIDVIEQSAEVWEVTWLNQTDADLCGLAVNPFAESRHAGLNELEAGTVIPDGRSHTLSLPEGLVVVEAYDCAGHVIAAELDGLRIPDEMFVNGQQVPFIIGGVAQSEGG